MKRFLYLCCAIALFIGQTTAQQRLVQGQVHPIPLPDKEGGQRPSLRADQSFTFDDIKYWVGEGQNRAALVIEWHDGNDPDAIVWGYKWNGNACGLDMISAIAQADPRLIFLRQHTGPMGSTINGLGYNCPVGSISYDLEGAKADSRVSFKFQPPYKMPSQTGHPATPEEDVRKALADGYQTGVIDHPFNAHLYGYPAYDYDYWKCSSGTHWDAGWYEGYWSYWVRDSQTDDFTYSGLGASSRKLVNGSWDGWSYLRDMTIWTGAELGDSFTAAVDPNAKPVTGVTLNQSVLTMHIPNAYRLTHTITPADADIQTVTWESSEQTVATVNNQGLVTAVAPGKAKITVETEDGGFTAICEVTVTDPFAVTGVALDKTDLTLPQGKTQKLTATITPPEAKNKNVTWRSSNKTIAKVNDQGLVTAVAPGKAKITVKTDDGGFTAICEVTVTDPFAVTGVALDKTDLTLPQGKTQKLTATITPPEAKNKNVTWRSSNKTIAKVDDQGLVTAIAPGTAKIRVETDEGGFAASCNITVLEQGKQPQSTSVNDTTVTLTFEKKVSALFYKIDVYLFKADKEVLFGSFRLNADGALIESRRGSIANDLSFTVRGLKPSSKYVIKMYAFNASDKLIAVYAPLELTTPTSNIPEISEGEVSVYENTLRLIGMVHHTCSIYSISGVLTHQFEIENPIEYRVLHLPAGVYLLHVVGKERTLTRKFIIH
ncbi:Ig-like domain-containing protein [Tannerella sp.]|uniref:Ig-like domain-containing protein n=1 Tax=Tannerella sp. TaxID=2382127 RepID=UPI003FA2DA23